MLDNKFACLIISSEAEPDLLKLAISLDTSLSVSASWVPRLLASFCMAFKAGSLKYSINSLIIVIAREIMPIIATAFKAFDMPVARPATAPFITPITFPCSACIALK